MSYVQLLAIFAFGFTAAIVFELVLVQTHRWYLDRKLVKHIAFRKAIIEELIEMGYVIDIDPWGPAGNTDQVVWQLDPDTGSITNLRPVKDPATEWLDDLQQQQSTPQKYNGADWL